MRLLNRPTCSNQNVTTAIKAVGWTWINVDKISGKLKPARERFRYQQQRTQQRRKATDSPSRPRIAPGSDDAPAAANEAPLEHAVS